MDTTPKRIIFTGKGCISLEQEDANVQHALGLGLPGLGIQKAKGIPLAIVGGGPSINREVGILRQWQGDIWAINGTWEWCRDRGIAATFLTIDPQMQSWRGVKPSDALLATCCHPGMFEALKEANINIFSIGRYGFSNGPTTASTAPQLAARTGHAPVTFFGCESSFPKLEKTHAYELDPKFLPKMWLRVRTNDGVFLTHPEFLMQAECLAVVVRGIPQLFSERSGGLLRAWTHDLNGEILEISSGLRAVLQGQPHEVATQ